MVQDKKPVEDMPGTLTHNNLTEFEKSSVSHLVPSDYLGKNSTKVSDFEKFRFAQSEAHTAAFVSSKMADQPLDHTIFLVGWGYDEKTEMPYWIVRNSYGDKWGMNGDFLVRRGHDDFGIESELSGYEVELIKK